jgi:recombinational DNA repair protein (RecF pathway)
MYEIDSTQGYILSHTNIGEANKSYRILTRDYGLVTAHATSVRKEQSKLAHFLQLLSHIELEAIQSRKGYQITGGQLLASARDRLDFPALGVLDRLGQLILRVSGHSEHDSQLYAIFHDIDSQLQSLGSPAPKYLDMVELWGSGRILRELGYFNPAFCPDISPEIFDSATLGDDDCAVLQAHKGTLDRYLQECIAHTML